MYKMSDIIGNFGKGATAIGAAFSQISPCETGECFADVNNFLGVYTDLRPGDEVQFTYLGKQTKDMKEVIIGKYAGTDKKNGYDTLLIQEEGEPNRSVFFFDRILKTGFKVTTQAELEQQEKDYAAMRERKQKQEEEEQAQQLETEKRASEEAKKQMEETCKKMGVTAPFNFTVKANEKSADAIDINFKYDTTNKELKVIPGKTRELNVVRDMMSGVKIPKESGYNEKLKELIRLRDANMRTLQDNAKMMNSVEQILAQKSDENRTQRILKIVDDSVEEPFKTITKEYDDELKKVAANHQKYLLNAISKTSLETNAATVNLKRKITETQRKVQSYLSGKTKSLYKMSSKLKAVDNQLVEEQKRIDIELLRVPRFVSVKEKILDWIDGSEDRTPLTEDQIYTIAEAFSLDKDYKKGCDNFIEEMKNDTMYIIGKILKDLGFILQSLKDSGNAKATTFQQIIIDFMNGLLRLSQKPTVEITAENLEKILATSIEDYINRTGDESYMTPFVIPQVKKLLTSILDNVKLQSSVAPAVSPLSLIPPQELTLKQKQRLEQEKIQEAKGIMLQSSLDVLTPIIKKIREDIVNKIPDIGDNQLLLYTIKKGKQFMLFGKETYQNTYYYIDEDGSVKKLKSGGTYKLSINEDGSIPPQLTPISIFKSKSDTSSTKSESPKSDSFTQENPNARMMPRFSSQTDSFSPNSPIMAVLPQRADSFGSTETNTSASSSPSLSSRFMSSFRRPSKNTSAVKKPGVLGRLNLFGKTAKSTEGGKHRTRKFRKSKTRKNKRHSRR
jgi:hypothetical protein